jgi:hypothetical protein
MTPSGIKTRLTSLTKGLATRWDETKNYWKDVKSQEFEQRYMTELFANVEKTVTVLEKLDEILAKVRKDCE